MVTGETNENYPPQKALNILVQNGIVIRSRTIGTITFTGVGIDDMSNGGEFTGNVDVDYEIVIDATGTPDTFKWSDDGGATYTEGVAITGSNQLLSNGVTIKFNATTGHTLADKWEFTARAADPTTIQKNIEQVIGVSLAASADITSSPIDLRNIEEGALTIWADFHASATLGITVEIFTSPDNIDYDVDPYASVGLEPTFAAGVTKQRTSPINLPVRFMKVKITNDDGSYGVPVKATATKLEK